MKVVKTIIDEVGANQKEFSAIDVIRKYFGNYRNNSIKYVVPIDTINSQFGKLLKDNMGDLNIEEVKSDVNAKDDDGKKTTTSIWKAI